MLIYLGGPIDKAEQTDRHLGDLRLMVKSHARRRGWSVFDPSHAFAVSGGPTPQVQNINWEAIRQANGLVALLPEGYETVGVPMEIQRGVDSETPTVVISNNLGSWALAGCGASIFPETAVGVGDAIQSLENRLVANGQPHGLLMHKLVSDSQLPTKAYAADAGWDLYSHRTVEVKPNEFVDVPLGTSMALPRGYFARITGRSSTFRRRRLLVLEGVIDSGYRGPLFAGVTNLSDDVVVIQKGERIAQLIIHDVPDLPLVEVSQLPASERGTKGFGSSGA